MKLEAIARLDGVRITRGKMLGEPFTAFRRQNADVVYFITPDPDNQGYWAVYVYDGLREPQQYGSYRRKRDATFRAYNLCVS